MKDVSHISEALIAKAQGELARRAVDPAHIAAKNLKKALSKREFIEVAKGNDWTTFSYKTERKVTPLEDMLANAAANMKEAIKKYERNLFTQE